MPQRDLGDFSFSTNKGQGTRRGLCSWGGEGAAAGFCSVPGIIHFPKEMIDPTLPINKKETIFWTDENS